MRTLHLVSHTHWDREWYLTFQQFRLKLVHLIDNLLDILERDDRYKHFMLDGQTIILEDYLAMRPEREADLRRYIQAGRILIGPWYILPDEFLVSPEATIRNLLEGDKTARLFGPKMRVGYIPDPFGHIGQLPQVLRGFGIGSACVMRGLADEPCEFWWQAPDESRVLMSYLRDGYGNVADLPDDNSEAFSNEAYKIGENLAQHSASSHILLMQGTDHMEPKAGTCAALEFAQSWHSEASLIHSTLPAYFSALNAMLDLNEIPVVKGELRSSKRHPLLPGVLSTRMWIKQRNRACETLLEKWAEPFNTWATRAEYGKRAAGASRLRSPEVIIRQAWRLLMQCHPHDSICGCSIDQVHDEMHTRFDQVEQIGEEITRQSLEALAEKITTLPDDRTNGAEYAVVVFNPTRGPRIGKVTVVLEGLCEQGEIELVNGDGEVLPYQRVGMGSTELMNMVMKPNELRESFGMITDGVVMGWKVRDLQVRRENNAAFIEMLLVEKGVVDFAAWERGKQAVEAAMSDPALDTFSIHVRTAEANQITFCAANVPAHGYRTLWIRRKRPERTALVHLNLLVKALLPVATRLASSPFGKRVIGRLVPDPASKPPYCIENEYLRVETQADGTIDVLDKQSGAIYRGQNRLVDGGDQGDEYNYSPPSRDQLITARRRSVRLEKGALQNTLEIRLELAVPVELASDRRTRSGKMVLMPVTSRITLIQGVPRVEIHTEVDNLARDHRLRVHFPAPFAATEGQHDGHFEVVRRPVGIPAYDAQWIEQPRPETCQRAFTAIDDRETGLLVANRGLPEVEVLKRADGNAEIAVTLLRCVGWLSRDDLPERKGHAGPGYATPGAQMPGRRSFDYAIVPYCRGETLAAYHQAYAFEAPMRGISTSLHEGVLPEDGSFLQVTPESFVLSAVMECEDGHSWLARGYNLSDETIVVRLRTMQPFQRAERVNLLEEVQETLSVIDEHTANVQVKGHEIVTIKFRER